MRKLVPVVAIVLAACTGRSDGADAGLDGASGDALVGLTAITIAPADLTLRVGPGLPGAQAYTALGTFSDGHSEDVTAHVAFSLPAADGAAGLGGFTGAMYSTLGLRGGRTTVSARNGDVVGTTPLTLRLTADIDVAPSAGAALPPHPASTTGPPRTTPGSCATTSAQRAASRSA